MVGVSNPKNYTSTVGVVLAGHLVRTSADEAGEAGIGRLSAPGGLVPQGSSDLLRRARLGAQRVVGPGGADFLRVACTDRHDKSSAGIC